jgi:hypothetical protein
MKAKNNKKNPSQCTIQVECKATASLNEKTKEELQEEDKPLKEILDDPNSN